MNRRIRGLDADQRREQRRSQLLDAALDLFAQQGYVATSIEQICQHAYVGTKGFYETFDGREDCYIALLKDLTARTESLMSTRLNDDADDRTLVETFTRALVADPRIAHVAFGRGMAVIPALEHERRANRRWAADFVVRLWQTRAPERQLPSGAAELRLAATGLIGGMFDLIATWLLDADPEDPAAVDSLVRDLTDFYTVVVNGLGSRAGTPS